MSIKAIKKEINYHKNWAEDQNKVCSRCQHGDSRGAQTRCEQFGFVCSYFGTCDRFQKRGPTYAAKR